MVSLLIKPCSFYVMVPLVAIMLSSFIALMTVKDMVTKIAVDENRACHLNCNENI